MPRLPLSGADDGIWGSLLNDYLLEEHDEKGKHRIKSILKIPYENRKLLMSDIGYDGYLWSSLTAADVGLAQVDNTSDLDKPMSSAAETALGNKLNISGGSLSGNINMNSSYSGGDNTTDSTKRIILHSYQKAQLKAADNVSPAHFGEVIRIDLERQAAKGAIAFRENYTGSGSPRTVAWLVAHGQSNDDPNDWHNHFSIEIPDENGMLQTALEFPFATRGTPNGFGSPLSSHYVRSTRKFIAANNGITVENQPGVDKNIHFSIGPYGGDDARRWSLQGDSSAEGGGNTGTNFRISRRSDSGGFIDSPLYIQRSTGNVGIGNVTSPTARIHVERANDGAIVLIRNTLPSGNLAPNIGLDAQTTNSRVLQAGLQSDTAKRISIEASGLIEWGQGGNNNRDTNLYRLSTGVLASDSNIAIKTAGRGLQIAEGTNAKMGSATLSTGSATINTTAVKSQSRIFLCIQDYAGATIPNVSVGSRIAGASFTIRASTTENITVAWVILDPV